MKHRNPSSHPPKNPAVKLWIRQFISVSVSQHGFSSAALGLASTLCVMLRMIKKKKKTHKSDLIGQMVWTEAHL